MGNSSSQIPVSGKSLRISDGYQLHFNPFTIGDYQIELAEPIICYDRANAESRLNFINITTNQVVTLKSGGTYSLSNSSGVQIVLHPVRVTHKMVTIGDIDIVIDNQLREKIVFKQWVPPKAFLEV